MALRKPKKVVQPAWHPNFRNVETLPDIKAIRTDFVINYGVILLAATLLVFFLKNEFSIMAVGRENKDFETKISENTGINNNNLKLSGQFGNLSKEIAELSEFTNVPIKPSDLLLKFTEIKPEEMLFHSISYNTHTIRLDSRKSAPGKQISIRSTVIGTPASVTQLVTEFVETLQNLEIIQESVQKVELQSLVRDEKLGLFNCSIRIELVLSQNK